MLVQGKIQIPVCWPILQSDMGVSENSRILIVRTPK